MLRRVRERYGREEDRLEALVGAPGLWGQSREFQFEFLIGRNLQPRHRLLEIGCGPLRAGIPLVRYLDRCNYTGVDVRPDSVAVAWRQIAKAGLVDKAPHVTFSTSFGGEELRGRTFDYVWAFQVLYHLEDSLTEACFAQVRQYLGLDSVFLANVNAVGVDGAWKEFPYVRRDLEFYRALAERHDLSMKVLGQLRDFGYTQKVRGQLNHMLEFRARRPTSAGPAAPDERSA
jgi:2-polyprenyl-3-methyl-5-hydroxy-6-metoxy-1,4-benzoquinol methylase